MFLYRLSLYRLVPDPPQHRRIRLSWDRQSAGQPVREVVVGKLQQRFQRRKLRLAQRVYVPLHETSEQHVALVRPAMGGAIQQTAAPRIAGGWFWFTHRRGVI